MRHRWLVGAVVLGLLTVGGMPGAAASQRLPNGSSTLDVPTITVDVYTGTPDTFEDEVSLTNGESGTLVLINFTFPAGVTLTDAAIDTGASSCSDEVGTVTRSGNTVKIADIACANGQELAVDVDGESSISVVGSYDVSSEFKTQAPRRPQQQTTMWQEFDYGSFVVED